MNKIISIFLVGLIAMTAIYFMRVTHELVDPSNPQSLAIGQCVQMNITVDPTPPRNVAYKIIGSFKLIKNKEEFLLERVNDRMRAPMTISVLDENFLNYADTMVISNIPNYMKYLNQGKPITCPMISARTKRWFKHLLGLG